jgi:hypothetical protein
MEAIHVDMHVEGTFFRIGFVVADVPAGPGFEGAVYVPSLQVMDAEDDKRMHRIDLQIIRASERSRSRNGGGKDQSIQRQIFAVHNDLLEKVVRQFGSRAVNGKHIPPAPGRQRRMEKC